MRRSLTITLKFDELRQVPTSALERLVRSMGVEVARRPSEADGSYRHRVIQAVQRWEAKAAAGRVALYEETR